MLDAAAQRADEQLAQYKAKLATSHQDAIAQLEETQQQEADLTSELNSLRQLHEQSLDDLRTQHHSELTQLQAELSHAHQNELNTQLSELRKQHQADVGHQQQLSEQFAAESAQMLTETQAHRDQALAELQHEHLLLTQKLEVEHQQSVERQGQDFAEQLQVLQSSLSQEHAGELIQAQKRSAALVSSMQAEHDSHQQELQQLQQKMQEQLGSANAQHHAELDVVVEQCQV